ncbi:MAG: hypothetical protein K6357_06890 [Elusimicrobiota bacterium]
MDKKLYIHNPVDNKQSLSIISRLYKLKKVQDYEFEEKFKSKIEASYQKTLEKYNLNFTYSIKPEGAIYPFSEIKVDCISDNNISASKVEEVCNEFFKKLDFEYEKIKLEIK